MKKTIVFLLACCFSPIPPARALAADGGLHTLTLSARPEVGLEIYIDGVTTGLRTPQTISLPAGIHTVRLVAPRFETEPVWSTEYADGTASDYILHQYNQSTVSESIEPGCTLAYNATDVTLFGDYSLKATNTPGMKMRAHPNLSWHWLSQNPWIANPLEIRESMVNVWTYVSGSPGPAPNWFSLITVVFDAGWDSGTQVTTTDILTEDMKIREWFWLDSGKGNRQPVVDAPRYPLDKWVKLSLYTKLDGAQSHVMVFQDDYLVVDAPNVDFQPANKRPDYMHWGGYGSEGNGTLTIWNSRTSVERVTGPGPAFSFARWEQDGRPVAGNVSSVQIDLTADAQLTARGDVPLLDGDINGDCRVNILDLIVIRSRLEQDPQTGDNWRADANNDGAINILDLIYVRNKLNTRCVEETFGAESNPTGDPIGGGGGYRRIVAPGAARVTTKAELLNALANASAGSTVYVDDSAEIDLSGCQNVLIPSGVTLAGGRGRNGSAGALIFSTQLETFPLFKANGPTVRLTGLRLRGPDPERRTEQMSELYQQGQYYSIPNSRGIQTTHPGLEVDNCELSGWSHAAVFLMPGATGANVHHNDIHHNQRWGLGYGVCLDTADALIEANTFAFCRHAIAGTGRPGTSYEARYNVVAPEDGDGHSFDMHGGADRGDGTNIAGDWIKIHHNTFQATSVWAVVIRGVPTQLADIHHNWFLHSDPARTVLQSNATGNMEVHDNRYGPLKLPMQAGR